MPRMGYKLTDISLVESDCVAVVGQGMRTALHYAAWKNSLQVAELLSDAKADVHSKNQVSLLQFTGCSRLTCGMG